MKPSEFINAIRVRANDERSLAAISRELDVDYQIFQRFVAGSKHYSRVSDILDKLAARYGFEICEDATKDHNAPSAL
ncbi:hypothetical protein ACQZ5N_00995 [Agrobacterium sp. 22-221-1]